MSGRKVSVLMPVYNGEKFIASSIGSILNQTYNNFEFIIIDDASTDNSFNIISRYKDSRIKLFRNNFNIGQTKTLNKAIGFSEGEFIARMDQDDIALKERLSKQVGYLLKHNEISAVGTSVIIINEAGKKIGVLYAANDQEQLKLEILFNNPIAHSSAILRKKALLDIGCYNEDFILGQDYELWSRMLLSGYKITNIKEPFLFFRMHSNSSTVTLNPSRLNIEVPKIIKKNIKFFTGIDISLQDAERISWALHDPGLLGNEEFGYIDAIFDTIFERFKNTQGRLSWEVSKSIAKFKYILALGYIKKNNLQWARLRFLDSFKTYPNSLNPLINYFFTLFGIKVCRQARFLKQAIFG